MAKTYPILPDWHVIQINLAVVLSNCFSRINLFRFLPAYQLSKVEVPSHPTRRYATNLADKLVMLHHKVSSGNVLVLPLDFLVILALKIFPDAFLILPFRIGKEFTRIVRAPKKFL